MEVLSNRAELREWLSSRPDSRLPRGLVPTMGALHRGHTSLFERARSHRPDSEVVATLFVNPTQFGPGEDYEAYPRTRDDDLAKCREHGVAAVFAPEADELYAPDASVLVHEEKLARRLCGASRPGHFAGVCTVVAKLFHLVRPDFAVFGEKDFQQLAVIRRMVRDLDFSVEIVGAPTVREPDGLALSSRNTYLDEAERSEAPTLYRALREGAETLARNPPPSLEEVVASMRDRIETCGHARIDYLEIVDAETLEPAEPGRSSDLRIVAAVYFGSTRLIDNVGAKQ